MQVVKSPFSGALTESAIRKSAVLDNVDVEVQTLPHGQIPTIQILYQATGYLYRFGIPEGAPGPDSDLYDNLTALGYRGTEQQMQNDLLNLLQPT